MKKSRLIVLVMAVAAAGGAFVLANTPKPPVVEAAAPPPPAQTDDILTASHDLPIGTLVSDGDVTWQSWPKTAVAPGMIVKTSDPKAVDDIRGSIVRAAFFQGEPMHREKLLKGAGAGFLSAILPSGMRAVSINIDPSGSTNAGGFILPNDRVDLIHTFADQSKTNGGGGQAAVISETLLRNIKVLAIGQNIQDKGGQAVAGGSNATLELDPVQAETVILAQRVGQLSLVLRSVLDTNKDGDVAEKGDKTMTIVRYGSASEGEVR